MRTRITGLIMIMLTATACMTSAVTVAAEEGVTVEPVELLSDAELKELVGPVALYPDDLLAIVLPASAYPLQVVAAARYRQRAESDSDLKPDEDWDESIVALLNYPEALALLNDDIDWTWELGQAVLSQEQDVLQAVQSFRNEAYAAGNLSSDEYQKVSVDDATVTIEPLDNEVVYVPYYEPELVTVYQPRRVYHYYSTPYPVYYYPYSHFHSAYDHHFWGISSFFALSWSGHHLNHYLHDHRRHRFYGHTYHRNHFRRTHFYVAPRAHQRRWAQRYDHRRFGRHTIAPRRDGRWYANRSHTGARPHVRNRSQADTRGHYRQERPRQRHIERKGQHRYDRAALTNRLNDRGAGRAERRARPQREASGQHREQRRRALGQQQNQQPRARDQRPREARPRETMQREHRQREQRQREQRRVIARRQSAPQPQRRAERAASPPQQQGQRRQQRQQRQQRQPRQQRPVMQQRQRAQQAPQRVAQARSRPQQRAANPAPRRERVQVQPRSQPQVNRSQPRAAPRARPQRGARSERSGRHMERNR